LFGLGSAEAKDKKPQVVVSPAQAKAFKADPSPKARPAALPAAPTAQTSAFASVDRQMEKFPIPNIGAGFYSPSELNEKDEKGRPKNEVVKQVLSQILTNYTSGMQPMFGSTFQGMTPDQFNSSEELQEYYKHFFTDQNPNQQQFKIDNKYLRDNKLCPVAMPPIDQFAGKDCDKSNRYRMDRMTCMVCNIYYEGLSEGLLGQIAIGDSVMTRLYNLGFPGQDRPIRGEPLGNPSESTVCNIVFDNTVTPKNRRVAQYSWTLENKSHVMQRSNKLESVVRAAYTALCTPPGTPGHSWSNYANMSLVNPGWMAFCPEQKGIGAHTFCRDPNSVKVNRNPSVVLAAERRLSSGEGAQSLDYLPPSSGVQ
jgi:spore germination cell wall hydrolase CwlJ-like protein